MKRLFQSKRLWGVIGSLIIIMVLATAYFYPDDINHNVLQQADMQQGAANSRETQLWQEATGEHSRWTNSLFSGMPTFQISPSYPSNSLFTWINTVMGMGLPSPANLLAMMMVGFLILLLAFNLRWYVALIGAIAYGFSSYFIIIIGAGHIWKFITLAYVPPTIAGVVLAYRGKYLIGGAVAALFAMMQIAGNHVQMSYYFLWVTVAFALVYLVRAIRSQQLRQWGIATGVLALAGALAVTANLPSLYNTYEYSKETIRGAHSELSTPDDNPNATAGLDRNYITQYSYGTAETASLLIPNIKGGASVKPEKGSHRMLTLADMPQTRELQGNGSLTPQETQFLGYMSQYFGEPEGTNGPIYVGALIVALFLLGCVIVRGGMKWALLALTVLSILLALGRNCMWLTDLMIDYMPMYSKFRTVESILVIAEFTMPLLAAMALQKLLTTPDAWTVYRKPLIWCFGVPATLCLLCMLVPSIMGNVVTDNDQYINSQIASALSRQGADSSTLYYMSLSNPRIYSAIVQIRHAMIQSDALRSLIILAAGMGVLWLFFNKKLTLGMATLLIGVIVTGDLYMADKRYLNTDSFMPRPLTATDSFPMTVADRKILADTTANFRVLDIPRFNQAAPSFYHKSVGGYHAAKLTRYQDLIDRHLNAFLYGSPSEADMNVINMLNTRYVVPDDTTPLYNDEALGNAWFVDSIVYVDGANAEMNALSIINPAVTAVADAKFEPILKEAHPVEAGDTIFETSYAPNRLTYHATSARGGVAVLSEIYFPWGWNATIDGVDTPIGRVDYVLRALRVPAGSHTIELTYDPQSLHTTTAAAYVAIILIYLAMIGAIVAWVVQRRRK